MFGVRDIRKMREFFLTGIFALIICASLQAEERAVFYGDALVYGKEYLFIKQNTPSKSSKEATKIKEEKPAPVKNEIKEHKPIAVVFPISPLAPSSSSFMYGSSESAVVSSQQRVGEDEQAGKACRENMYPNTQNLNLSIYYPKQRQKLSIAATQCGVLTSFGAQSPPDSLTEMSSRA